MAISIDYGFRFPVDSYSVWSDLLPDWVIEGADEFSKANGFSFTRPVTCPNMLQPVHDSLHFYTSLSASEVDEHTIAGIEHMLQGDTQWMDEATWNIWNNLDDEIKDWYAEFYSACQIGYDSDQFDYINAYRDELYKYDIDLYNKIYK